MDLVKRTNEFLGTDYNILTQESLDELLAKHGTDSGFTTSELETLSEELIGYLDGEFTVEDVDAALDPFSPMTDRSEQLLGRVYGLVHL